MKKLLIILVAVLCCLQVHAQADSLAAPQSVVPQQLVRPYYYGLHQGLNVQLSASVMAAFGKYAPRGASFAQSLQATYLAPLNSKLTLMLGGYVSNLTWGGIAARNAGLYGELSYQFNEHWEAHVYGQKNIVSPTPSLPKRGGGWMEMASAYGLYSLPLWEGQGWGYAADRIGAGIRYMPNPTLSIEVNVEQVWLPNQSYMPYTGGDFHQHVSSFAQQHGMPNQR